MKFYSINAAHMQIPFVEERHHCVGDVDCPGREVVLYDSCFNGTLTPSVELQLYADAADSHAWSDHCGALQQQYGTNNCGLFQLVSHCN